MRKNIEFNAEGVVLRGWLYLPDGTPTPVPTVVMAHGFSALKEQYLDDFAQGQPAYDDLTLVAVSRRPEVP